MTRLSLVVLIFALMSAGAAIAFQALPPGAQVNDDLAAGIDKQLSVSGEDPTNADVVGGALSAGAAAVPWAVFRQQESGAAHDQVFSRSFDGGAWTTRGSGTVGGRSSAAPTFAGSLNFDQGQDGGAPAIDFAGSERTAPWTTWHENTTGAGFAENNVFASRFDNTGDANQGKWIFAGQSRGLGGGSVPIPSLNIHTDQDAENPSVAGGSAADPSKPGPWVTWQETSPGSDKDQIFVVRPLGPGQANCDGVTPAGTVIGGHIPAVGGFCWQQTGIPRAGPGAADPSLNVDPTRNGIEPDIAFAGVGDGVPWVVWYEIGPAGVGNLHSNELVFAAKAENDGAGANGGFHWVVVGNQLGGTLDTTGTNGFGKCAETASNEGQCSLNNDPSRDAENPRVAAGTMSQGEPTTPWVAWDEDVAGVKQVFVSRLAGAGTSAHFEIVNGGLPISTGSADSTRPDITFSANTPYVSWREAIGGVVRGFVGHFVDPASPTFVLDENKVPLTPTSQADVREPISSSCIPTPFDSDGSACPVGEVGTPFFLFTNGAGPLGLFADAYLPEIAPGAPPPSSPLPSSLLSASPGQTVAILGRATAVAKVSGTSASVLVSCAGAATATCGMALKLTVTETLIRHRLVAISASAKARRIRKLILVGSASATLEGGQAQLVHIALNKAGKLLLERRHTLMVRLRVTQARAGGMVTSIANQVLTFRLPRKRK